jgi:hypothetical protein
MLKFGKHHRCRPMLTLGVRDERMKSLILATIVGALSGVSVWNRS